MHVESAQSESKVVQSAENRWHREKLCLANVLDRLKYRLCVFIFQAEMDDAVVHALLHLG